MIDKLDEALDCCEHGLNLEPTNAAILEVQSQCRERKKEKEERIRAKEEKERKERETKAQLENAIQARGIKINVTDKNVRSSAGIQYDAETDTLQWPVFFLSRVQGE